VILCLKFKISLLIRPGPQKTYYVTGNKYERLENNLVLSWHQPKWTTVPQQQCVLFVRHKEGRTAGCSVYAQVCTWQLCKTWNVKTIHWLASIGKTAVIPQVCEVSIDGCVTACTQISTILYYFIL